MTSEGQQMAYSNYINIKQGIENFCKENKISPYPTLIAVSKTVGVDEILEAVRQGCVDFGENRPDDLVHKAEAVKDVNWHFIGNIQSRQLKKIVCYADYIHSLFDISHAAKIDKLACELGKIQKIFIEVNVSGEESKSGVRPDDLSDFYDECKNFKNVQIEGLMTMAPKAEISSSTTGSLPTPQETFKNLRKLGLNLGLSSFSMGMSDDYKDAILAGSTYIRVGRAIFDENYQQKMG